MTRSPFVSVLITVYNDEKNIRTAIESILNQTFRDFEIVVVNDGSTDETEAVLDSLKQEHPDTITVLTQDNSGTATAANSGLKVCRGKYIARLDSDDISYKHRLQTEVDILEANPDAALVGGGCHISDKNGNIIGERNIHTKRPHKILLRRCVFQQSDVMFRKKILEKVGKEVYRKKFKAEDYDLWLRISEVAKIIKIDDILGIWRLNAGGYTLSRKEEQLEAIKVLRSMAFARRSGKEDCYENFEPKIADRKHRSEISSAEYDLCVAQVMIKAGKLKEAGSLLKKHRENKTEWNKMKKWYLLTYMPAKMIKILFGIREMILNNTNLEIR